MKLVLCIGEVWKLTDGRYKALIMAISKNKPVEMKYYGTRLGTPVDVSDMTQVEACQILDELVGK